MGTTSDTKSGWKRFHLVWKSPACHTHGSPSCPGYLKYCPSPLSTFSTRARVPKSAVPTVALGSYWDSRLRTTRRITIYTLSRLDMLFHIITPFLLGQLARKAPWI